MDLSYQVESAKQARAFLASCDGKFPVRKASTGFLAESCEWSLEEPQHYWQGVLGAMEKSILIMADLIPRMPWEMFGAEQLSNALKVLLLRSCKGSIWA